MTCLSVDDDTLPGSLPSCISLELLGGPYVQTHVELAPGAPRSPCLGGVQERG